MMERYQNDEQNYLSDCVKQSGLSMSQAVQELKIPYTCRTKKEKQTEAITTIKV